VAVALGASVWLALFAYKHVEYSNDMWWRFALEEDAPRSLRAAVGAGAVALTVAILKLLRPAPLHLQPSGEELALVREIVERSTSSPARLALTGDKSFLFDRSGSAFLMYAIAGRTWAVAGETGWGSAALAGAAMGLPRPRRPPRRLARLL
jgi:phosphatidylglycerol lysyltransferase